MDESFYQRALDETAGDAATRLLLAEWLRLRGDPRTIGYEWLARHAKRPLWHQMMWRWWTIGMEGTPSAIDSRLAPLLEGYADKEKARFSYKTRQEAEEAVGKALTRDEGRKAERGASDRKKER